jgi:hypothetical protein
MSKYFIIICLLIGSATFAQTAIITGKVLDAKTGLPLGGDSIVLVEKSISAVSDQNGIFIFNKLPAGNYSLKCKHKGYYDKIVTDIIVLENENPLVFNTKDEAETYIKEKNISGIVK